MWEAAWTYWTEGTLRTWMLPFLFPVLPQIGNLIEELQTDWYCTYQICPVFLAISSTFYRYASPVFRQIGHLFDKYHIDVSLIAVSFLYFHLIKGQSVSVRGPFFRHVVAFIIFTTNSDNYFLPYDVCMCVWYVCI